jgi:peptidoglycan/LPS O-acetylase OafA/YrhL
MRAAHQQHWDINFAAINYLHIPVALISMLALAAIAVRALWRRRLDDIELLATTVCVALLGNAFLCGCISGPHDRYGARMVWIATFVALIAAARYLAKPDEDASGTA